MFQGQFRRVGRQLSMGRGDLDLNAQYGIVGEAISAQIESVTGSIPWYNVSSFWHSMSMAVAGHRCCSKTLAGSDPPAVHRMLV